MDASVLAQVLRDLPPITDPNVLVGTSTADDAGVYKLRDDLAIVQTVDFFTPIVDDPYTYGSIAAANSISDVYAMGATPLTALAIVAFPEDLDPSILQAVLRGGSDKAREAGINIIGGHTIKDEEPKYGLSVTGIVHPDKVWRNSTARAGDVLFLTKPIGTGILTTARRKDAIGDAEMAEAIEAMSRLNRSAAEIAATVRIHAATDITGFGLIGHLTEMIEGASIGADVSAAAVPILRGAYELAKDGHVPGGSRANLTNAKNAGVTFDESLKKTMKLVLCDAQTSGGLLLAVSPDEAGSFEQRAKEAGVPAARIGTTSATPGLRIHE